MVDVELSALTKRYGESYAVDDIDLLIPSGSFVTLLGPSGCGKTTTLRSIAGLEEPNAGAIRIGDRTVLDVAARIFVPPERRKVGMVFQSYALWPHMTVAQNVAYPLKRQRLPRAEVDAEVDRILELVNLSVQKDRSVAALSGGQQQRVALARAMVGDPVLTLFDEPLSNLDVKLRGRMRSEIRRLHDRIGMTSVYVTHDQEEALALSDLVVVMNEGRVQQVGTPPEIYLRPANSFVADFVGYENRIPVRVSSGSGGAVRVRTPQGGEFEAASEVASDAAVVAFARSAALSFRHAPGLVPVGDGVVLDSTYLGTVYEYRVDIGGAVVLGRDRASGGEPPAFALGDRLSVFLDPAQAVVLVDDGAPGPSAPAAAGANASAPPDH